MTLLRHDMRVQYLEILHTPILHGHAIFAASHIILHDIARTYIARYIEVMTLQSYYKAINSISHHIFHLNSLNTYPILKIKKLACSKLTILKDRATEIFPQLFL